MIGPLSFSVIPPKTWGYEVEKAEKFTAWADKAISFIRAEGVLCVENHVLMAGCDLCDTSGHFSYDPKAANTIMPMWRNSRKCCLGPLRLAFSGLMSSLKFFPSKVTKTMCFAQYTKGHRQGARALCPRKCLA